MKRKVRITRMPNLKSGAEVKLQGLRAGLGFNSNVMPWPIMAGKMSAPDVEVNSTLKPVPRDQANLEAERGEIAMTPGAGGIPDTFKIGGKRHYEGGTPLNLPDDSFIFSDTAKMRIKDPAILAQFGMAIKKGGYTPADIAKKYNINDYKKVLADVDTDDLRKKTSEQMIANYNLKLAKLALVQESMKGFPQGIPKIAMPYIEQMNIDPAQFVQSNPGEGDDETSEGDNMTAAYGGVLQQLQARKHGGMYDQYEMAYGGLPKAQWGESILTGLQEALNAMGKGTIYLGETLGYGVNKLIGEDRPWNTPKYELPSEAIERITDPYRMLRYNYGTKEQQIADAKKQVAQANKYTSKDRPWPEYDPNLPIPPIRQITPGKKAVIDITGDPMTYYGVSGGIKNMIKAGKLPIEAASFLKNMTQKELLNLMDKLNVKNISQLLLKLPKHIANETLKLGKKAVEKIGPNIVPIADRLAPAIGKIPNNNSEYSDIMNYQKALLNAQNDTLGLSDYLRNNPSLQENNSSLQEEAYGGETNLPKAQKGKIVGPKDSKFVTYEDGTVINKQSGKIVRPGNPNWKPVVQNTPPPIVQVQPAPKPKAAPKVQTQPSTTTSTTTTSEPEILITPWKGDEFASKYSPEEWRKFAKAVGFKPKTRTEEKQNAELQDWLASNPTWAPTVKGLHKKHGMPKYSPTTYRDAKLGLRWDEIKDAIEAQIPKEKEAAKPAVTETPKAKEETTSPYVSHLENLKYADNSDAPWWLQDVIGIANAATNYATVKQYNPWQATAPTTLPDVTFYDPRREIAANEEQQNMATQALSQFAAPQQFNARVNQIQGEGAKNTADILGKYNTLNVNLANQQSVNNAAYMNADAKQRAQEQTNLFDKYTIANQNYDNAKKQAKDALVKQYTQGITNRAYTQALNELYPQFAIDSSSGGMPRFHDPRSFRPDYSKEKTLTDYYNEVTAADPNLKSDPENAWKTAVYMMKMAKGDTSVDPWTEYSKAKGIVPSYQSQDESQE